jgi:hypothetical protein
MCYAYHTPNTYCLKRIVIKYKFFNSKMIGILLKKIYDNPDLLKGTATEKQLFLQTQGNTKAQGTGNKVTSHEACFAELLDQHGFVFITKKEIPVDISYYKYQPNGTQKSPDFEVYDKELNKPIKFDLKHSNSKSFYFNDGWYEKGIVYIISWSMSKIRNKVLIGYGDDVPTDEENAEMERFVQFKKECNRQNKKVGSLRKFVRFANQYSCERFNEEYSAEKFNAVLKSLE